MTRWKAEGGMVKELETVNKGDLLMLFLSLMFFFFQFMSFSPVNSFDRDEGKRLLP